MFKSSSSSGGGDNDRTNNCSLYSVAVLETSCDNRSSSNGVPAVVLVATIVVWVVVVEAASVTILSAFVDCSTDLNRRAVLAHLSKITRGFL